jgi:hypothetical protein
MRFVNFIQNIVMQDYVQNIIIENENICEISIFFVTDQRKGSHGSCGWNKSTCMTDCNSND